MFRLVPSLSLFVTACVTKDADDPLDTEAPTDDPIDTETIDTETTPQDDTPTDTGSDTGTQAPCLPDPSLTVLDLTASAGILASDLEVQITLSAPATVAVQCTMDADPEEIFFVESEGEGTEHTLHLWGLIPRESYSCTAAPTCPEMATAATSFGYETPESPDDLRQVSIDVDPTLGMQGAWTLAPFSLGAFFAQTYIVAWGPEGRPRWWWALPDGVGVWIEALYEPEEGAFVWGGGFDEDGRTHIIDPIEGETYAWGPPGWEQETFHHDGKRIADGRMMTLEIRENSEGFDSWDGFGLRLHDPATGDISFDFDSQSLVDDGLLGTGNLFNSDPYHANWMDWQETADGPVVYVSLCFGRQILAIDEATGDLLWQFGPDLGWEALDEVGDPLDDSELPQCQHGLEVDGDNILVYDNAQDRALSVASEWQIDAASQTATRLWSWSEAGWQEDYLGDIDYLPGDRVLVTEAASFGVGEIVEVDRATGAVASRTTFDNGGYIYRSERYEGCDLFSSVRYCEALEARYREVEALLSP